MDAKETEQRLEDAARASGVAGKEVPGPVAALLAGFLKGPGGKPLKASELDAMADDLLKAWSESLGEDK